MKLPEKVRLSVDLIMALRKVRDGQPRRVKDLAAKLGTTEGFLHQIAAKLVKAEMINAIRGPEGGLLSSFRTTSVLEVYQLFGYMTDPIKNEMDSDSVSLSIRLFLEKMGI
jgi:DNA-binding IscR family transcriptional regulator